jgi:hypothetical protein
MSDLELIERTVEMTLQRMGYKPKCNKQWITFSEAVRILKPAGIGRRRLEKLMEAGNVKFRKDDMDVRNSRVLVDRNEIIKLLNK